MREPRPPGTPINMQRMRDWATEFAGYRINVTENRIDRWLDQFEDAHRDVAARLLDSVQFVSSEQMAALFRDALQSLSGWSLDENEREGSWLFVPFTGSSGESGDVMIQRFRHANNMAGKGYSNLFGYRADLLRSRLGPDDTVVLVDDFSGTGDQACDSWEMIFDELLPERPRVVLLLVAASARAVGRIASETEMEPHACITLGEGANLFSDACPYFAAEEKEILMRYGELADPQYPVGRGDCGFVVVFAHTCPNNTIPILHARRDEWEGLFRRYD